MATPIHTKYHRLFGARILLDINGECAPQKLINSAVNADLITDMIDQCSRLPRYIIQPELMNSIYKESMGKSLAAMIERKVANHLPFKEVLVEFEEKAELNNADGSARSSKVRHFIWLSESSLFQANHALHVPISEKFVAICWTLIDDIDDPAIVMTPLMATCSLITNEFAKQNNIPTTGKSSGTLIKAVLGPHIKRGSLSREIEESLITREGVAHAFSPVNDALCAMVLLLHTKGVVADRIEVPAKMNKARAASGKPLIQDHTVIRIGHVYNRSGEQIKYVPGASGRTMPVHWRAGHYRNQRFGVKLSKSYELWIEPMLINYVEGDTPVPKPKEVTI